MTTATPMTATVGRARPCSRAYAPIVVTGLVLALVPLRYSDSRTMMGVIISGMLFAAYAVAFNVIFGSTGQLFLCVGALAGLGGYTSAILSDRVGIPMVLSMALAGAGAAVIGGALSWIAVSRSLDVIFTGIVTLTFSLSFDNLLLGRRDLTGGETGLVVDAGSDTFLGEQVAPYYVTARTGAALPGAVPAAAALAHRVGVPRPASRRDRRRARRCRRQAIPGPGRRDRVGDARRGRRRVRPQRGVHRPVDLRLRPGRRACS